MRFQLYPNSTIFYSTVLPSCDIETIKYAWSDSGGKLCNCDIRHLGSSLNFWCTFFYSFTPRQDNVDKTRRIARQTGGQSQFNYHLGNFFFFCACKMSILLITLLRLNYLWWVTEIRLHPFLFLFLCKIIILVMGDKHRKQYRISSGVWCMTLL